MNEFKMVVEDFRASQQKIVEVMDHNFRSLKEQVGMLTEGQALLRIDVSELKLGQKRLEGDITELKTGQKRLEAGQARLETDVLELKTSQKNLEIGQAEIKADLKCKVSVDPFAKLAKRVTKLENKAA